MNGTQRSGTQIGKPLRLGNNREIQNQVVYQVMGSQSPVHNIHNTAQRRQGQTDDTRNSESTSSPKRAKPEKEAESPAGSESSKNKYRYKNEHEALLQQADWEGEEVVKSPFRKRIAKRMAQDGGGAAHPGQEQQDHGVAKQGPRRFPPYLPERTDPRPAAEASSFLEFQQDQFEIRAAIQELQGIIREKKQQFRIRNSMSMPGQQSKLTERTAQPSHDKGIMLPRHPVKTNNKKSRLLDYFP